MRVEAGVSTYYLRRRRQDRARRIRRALVAAAGLVCVGVVVFGFVYAGSGDQLASGIRIAGVDVGGLSTQDAQQLLARRAHALAGKPIVFTVSGHRFKVTAGELGVRNDWAAAVGRAQSDGGGFGPLRGFKRAYVRLFGSDVQPTAHASPTALRLWLNHLSAKVDRAHRDAALERHGLQIAVVPGQRGRVVDREAAAKLVVAALASFQRGRTIALPLRVDPPAVTPAQLKTAATRARNVLSGPVRLTLGPTYLRVSRFVFAKILRLPANGQTKLQFAGPEADKYFALLAKQVNGPSRDASFAVDGPKVRIVPSVDARVLDVRATARNLLGAAVTRGQRVAPIVVVSKPAKLTTQEAQKMGIVGLVSGYETFYGGIANRIHNVQLVAHLIDGHFIRPGQEFSFNQTTGERSAAKGFLVAPVIINGELSTGLGGGVCQVSTTVFNAAYEAGLNITARTNHALYISHYPQGRDATVDYPNVDLKFINDTGHWLLLRTFVTDSSLVVNLYGSPAHRKVESATSPLVTTGPAPVKKVPDPTLLKGQTVIDHQGSSSLSTSVERKVYTAGGKLLYDNTWYSSYRGDTTIERIGTKPKPKPKPKTPALPPGIPPFTIPAGTVPTVPATTTPASTSTTPTSTTPQH